MKEYWISPEDVKFDEKMSMFNTEKTPAEYEALKYQIEKGSQEDPILIRGGMCGDGVHRTRIAKELGRKVLAIDVEEELSDKEYILKCNKNTFAGRNLSSTQKAIKAYKLTTTFGYTDVEAIRNVGLPKGTKNVGYVRTIANSQLGKELSVISTLEQGKPVTINGKVTRSIDTARRAIKLYEEEAMKKEAHKNLDKIEFDYNDYLKTESGKDLFWKVHKMETREDKLVLIELINSLYSMDKLATAVAGGDEDHQIE